MGEPADFAGWTGINAMPPVYQVITQNGFSWITNFRSYYSIYVHSLFEYLQSKVGFRQRVDFSATGLFLYTTRFPYSSQEIIGEVVEHYASGEAVNTLLSGGWEIMPGMPQPLGLNGCDYLASIEITALLTVDLCNPEGRFTSIRKWCPVACGCLRPNGWAEECPFSCENRSSSAD